MVGLGSSEPPNSMGIAWYCQGSPWVKDVSLTNLVGCADASKDPAREAVSGKGWESPLPLGDDPILTSIVFSRMSRKI